MAGSGTRPLLLRLAAGHAPAEIVAHAIGTVALGERVALAAGDRSMACRDGSLVRVVARELRAHGHALGIVAPPSTTAGAVLGARRTDWATIPLAGRGERLKDAKLPRALVGQAALVAVNELDPEEPRRPVAIGLWARFAHPGQRLGAALSSDRDGLTPEIALAVDPALMVLGVPWRDATLVVAATDQIAAELAGRAALDLLAPVPAEPIGPWEQPLVQRATELGLGVRTPAGIRAERQWIGDPADPLAAEFERFAAALLARIGVDPAGSGP